MTDNKERELLRELVEYCEAFGHDWYCLEEARAVLAAAPATEAMPKFKRYDADGKEHPHGALVFFSDVVEAVGMLEIPVAAQATKPVAWYSAKVNDVITDAKKASRAKVRPWNAKHYDQPLYAAAPVAAQASAPDEYMCPNCVTPWKCNGPHIPQPAINPAAACEGSLCMQSNRCSYAPCRSGAPPQPAEQPSTRGDVVVTWDIGRTRILAVTRQDDDGQILSVIAEAPSASPAALTDEQRQTVHEAVAEAIGDAYDCTRAWSAWGVGTMAEDDFVLVSDDESRVAEIADAAIDAILHIKGEKA